MGTDRHARILRHKRGHCRGTAAVEFAVVCPLLLLCLVGLIEIGRAIHVRHTLVGAARAGCRLYTVKNEVPYREIYGMVDQIMSDAKLDGYTVLLNPPPTDNVDALEPVTVTVSIPYQRASFLGSSWFLQGKVISAGCVLPADSGGSHAK